MVKKRASLKDKGEELLGIKQGGKGADILFGAEGEAEPEEEGTLSAEEDMPQGEADLDEALSAEAEAAEAVEEEETPPGAAEYPAAEEEMPQGEADLDEALDLDSVLSAEAEAAEGEAALPELATTPAAPAPPPPPEPTTPPPVVERPLPAPISAPTPVVEPEAAPPPGVERPAPAPPPSTGTLSAPPEDAQPPPVLPPSGSAAVPPPSAAPSFPPAPTLAVAPPSTATGAPDHSVPRPPRDLQMVSGDFDLLADELPPEAAAAELIGAPEAVELTEEQREELLRRRSVQKDLADLDRAIDTQYDRILRDNVSVNKWITDWCHNLLAEARNIVLHQQVENLAKAEWNVQQVRARLDRAEESEKKALRYAWPITIWGVIWFGIFVYLIFDPGLLLRLVGVAESDDMFLVPEIFMRTLFFGGIGAVAAVFYHLFKYVQERSFDSQYGLSYVSKPFMGMILGSMIYLTVFVVIRALRIAPAGLAEADFTTITDVMYLALLYFIAMAAGFKENVAFDLLNRVLKSVLGGAQDEAEPATPPPATTETGP
jgi:hypothetical protein